ncbi:ABC-2 transporter permease [Siminovitchia sp. FSL H7-0308]|uniref:ABC-2 transporter permease n=1 Tax=Siminovitchia sp. FSL H7-0308 TaxID=2921432 RepID=UPI0030EDEB8D
MKGLIIKDLLTVINNGKGLLLMMTILAVAIVPTQDLASFVIAGIAICSMMSITSFSIDHQSEWEKFALTFPIKRQDIAKNKFITLVVFVLIGVILSTIIGGLVALILKYQHSEFIPFIALGVLLSLIFGTNSIVMLFKFGAEKTRMYLFVSYAVPGAIIAFIFSKLSEMGIVLTQQTILKLFAFSPIFVIIWMLIGYMLSARIMMKKEY